MKIKNFKDVKPEDVGDFGENTTIRWLISKEEGAENFAMRYFVIKKGGFIKIHEHPWEHEIFIVRGRGKVGSEKKLFEVKAGDFLFVPGNEPHQYVNNAEENFEFICIIPIEK